MNSYDISRWDANTNMLLRELEGFGTAWILTAYPVGILILKWKLEKSK
jgi:hypothetical protein